MNEKNNKNQPQLTLEMVQVTFMWFNIWIIHGRLNI